MSDQFNIKKISRKFGFNKDREGLITRYLKEQENWKLHIENTQKFILNTSKDKEKGICLVLGSGWLLDIPINELITIFNKVILVDISHPSQIIHKYKGDEKVEFVIGDITGILKKILKLNHSKNLVDHILRSFKKESLFGLDRNIKPDYVISANILSQLSFFPKKHLRKNRVYSETEINDFVNKIEQNHVDSLPENKSCLVSEYVQYEFDMNDTLLSENTRLSIDLSHKNFEEEWIWDFDLSGNYINNKKIRFKVAALQV